MTKYLAIFFAVAGLFQTAFACEEANAPKKEVVASGSSDECDQDACSESSEA